MEALENGGDGILRFVLDRWSGHCVVVNWRIILGLDTKAGKK